MKKYNFGAGPSILPQEVIRATAEACINFDGMDLSLMEISHRSPNFQAVIDEARALVVELLQPPADYSRDLPRWRSLHPVLLRPL